MAQLGVTKWLALTQASVPAAFRVEAIVGAEDLPIALGRGTERQSRRTLDLRDSTGAWAEYYTEGKPQGRRARPWESALSLVALLRPVGIGQLKNQ
jgi:hypothetical protein